ncbi:MAG: VWA domain-containing protein [Gemmatimonadota bacterium]|jgi:Ca-activated chloride channel family protein
MGARALIFTDASYLVIGAALTALVLVGLWSHGVRRRKLARFLGGRRALDRVSRADLSRYGVRRTLLLGLASAALAVAAAGPHWADAPEPVPPVKRAVLAIDISASMQAADVRPTRLAQAVDVARGLVDDLEGQEVGLVLYAGRPYPLAPPTRDLHAIRYMLSGVAPTVASAYDPGTQMSLAIDEAMALLNRVTDSTDAEPPSAAARVVPPEDMIIFVSDGDSQGPEEGLDEALERADEAGITVHAVGVGSEEATRIVMPRGTYQIGGTVTDELGAPALTRLDESTLRHLSETGAGIYARAGDVAALDAELQAPTVPPEPDPLDAPPAWAAYDIPFALGALALAFVFLESLIGLTLPRRSEAFRPREAT